MKDKIYSVSSTISNFVICEKKEENVIHGQRKRQLIEIDPQKTSDVIIRPGL